MSCSSLAHRLARFDLLRGYDAEGTRLFFVQLVVWRNVEVKAREFEFTEPGVNVKKVQLVSSNFLQRDVFTIPDTVLKCRSWHIKCGKYSGVCLSHT